MKLFTRLLIIPGLLCALLALNACVSTKNSYQKKAEQGDGEAQGVLGGMYLSGNGSLIDYQHARYWLRHGASNGDSMARYYLGVMYQYGHGEVVPDQVRAERHYKSVYEDIHRKAKKGSLRYVNILAEMYYYGRYLKQDKKVALKMFEECARRRWMPAFENLGIILLSDKDIEQNLSRAKFLLSNAAAYNYPRAQFFLAEYYFRQGNTEDAMEQLKLSADGGFPPAMFKLANESLKSDYPQDAAGLFKAAANSGYAPAMLLVAESIPETAAKLVWIKKATEHGSVPAMLQYAKLLKEQVNANPTKEMILYQLALKIQKNDPQIKKLIFDLDKKTGLFFPIKYTWENARGGENIQLANSEIDRVLKGFKAGIISGSKKLYLERLAYNPLPFFMNNDWYQFHENALPPLWSAWLFKAVEKHESDNAGFWIGYAVSAGLAGQGTAQAFAAFKLNELAKKRAENSRNNSLMNIAALMKANALILMNYDTRAYASLFANGNLMRDDLPFLINFINTWCKPLLKDKRKFSIATGIDVKYLGQFSLPQVKIFWSLEYGRKIFADNRISEPQIDFSNYRKK